MNYNEKHNLYPREIKIPTTVDTIMVKQRLHLQQVAEVLHIPLEMLEDMNPQYRINVIPYEEGSNPLFLPGEFGEKFVEKQDSIYAYKDSIFFDPEYLRRQPARYAYKENQSKAETSSKRGKHSTSSSSSGKTTTYVVKKGDSFGKIASKYGITVQDIRDWNHLKSNTAMLGQKLIVSKRDESLSNESANADTVKQVAHKETEQGSKKDKQKQKVDKEESKETDAVAEKSDSKKDSKKSSKETTKSDKTEKDSKVVDKSSKSKDNNESTEESKKESTKEASSKKQSSDSKGNIVLYQVKAGDTLWTIAQKYPGVTESEIVKLNGLKNANSIMKGMKLKIKVKS